VTVTTDATVEEEVAVLAKALGHPARVRIVRLLLAHDACYCGQLVGSASQHRINERRHVMSAMFSA
jgi:DNA-binding transcriptional ArsR family regulator